MVAIVSLVNLGFSHRSLIWEPQGLGIYEANADILAISNKSNQLFVGTNKALYKKDNNGAYKMVLGLQQETGTIHDIYIWPQNPFNVYVATDAGAFASHDAGVTFQSIFNPLNNEENRALSIFRSWVRRRATRRHPPRWPRCWRPSPNGIASIRPGRPTAVAP